MSVPYIELPAYLPPLNHSRKFCVVVSSRRAASLLGGPPFLLAAPIQPKHTSLCWDGGKMIRTFRWIAWSALSLLLVFCAAPLKAQLGNPGSIDGVVKDPSGATVPNAKVEISNPVTGYHRETTTDSDGIFHFSNIPFNPYHLTVAAGGFASSAQDVDVRSVVPPTAQLSLKVGRAETGGTVKRHRPHLIGKVPRFHTALDPRSTELFPH